MYVIVEFMDEGAVYSVPEQWVDENKCFWPPYTTDQRVYAATKSREMPHTSWAQYDIRVLGRAKTFETGREKMQRAFNQTDVDTAAEDEDAKRMRRPNSRYESSEEESCTYEVDLPDMPPKKKGKVLAAEASPPPPPAFQNSNVHGPLIDALGEGPIPRVMNPFQLAQKPKRLSTVRRTLAMSATAPLAETDKTAPPSAVSLQSALNQKRTLPTPSTPRHQPPATSTPVSLLPGAGSSRSSQLTPTSVYQSSTQNVTRMPSRATATAMELKLMAAIEDIKETQRHQNVQLTSIINYLKVDTEMTELPSDINLPLRTMEAVDQLEIVLNDSMKLNILVKFLATIGGADLKQTVSRILKQILAPQLATAFNWFGRGKKRAFSVLNLYKALRRATRKNRNHPHVTEVDISQRAREWLKLSADRVPGGRRSRTSTHGEELSDLDE